MDTIKKLQELNEKLDCLRCTVAILAKAALDSSDEEYLQQNIGGSLEHIKNGLDELHTAYYDIEYSLEHNIE
ncbi:MAG: hypothetical protein LUG93_19390 [Lachnospiraceae bacterium]|nr:hypothetical protein [Lachnospiraceae bacterium]